MAEGKRAAPPKIVPRALEIGATDPSRAWQMVEASQKNCTSRPDLGQFTSPEPQKPLFVRFVCISDTHNKHDWDKCPFTVPDGDVLVHAGDFTQVGDAREVAAFCKWFGALPHKRKILIAGNHDLSLHGETYAQTGAIQGVQAADAAEAASRAFYDRGGVWFWPW